VLAHDAGKRGSVLLHISKRGLHGIEVAIWSRQRIIAITCQPFGHIARHCYEIKDESFEPGGLSGGAGSAPPLTAAPVGTEKAQLDG
jgi:hypothetical protein